MSIHNAVRAALSIVGLSGSNWSARRRSFLPLQRFLRHHALIWSPLLLLSSASPARANTHFVLESVSDYSVGPFCGGSHACDTIANSEANGFYAFASAGTGWSPPYTWFLDQNVYDTDFYDPEVTGNVNDADTNNFDPPGNATSWVWAHGDCNDFNAYTGNQCTSDTNCGANSYCPSFPLASGQTAVCINQSVRDIWTASTHGFHGNKVTYGTAPGAGASLSFAIGEDQASGSFDGAGLNGGTNVALITNSCGFRSRYLYQDTARFFAGVHLLMFNMPVAAYAQIGSFETYFADTAQWAERGANLAWTALANLNAPASSAWLSPTQVNNSYNGYGGSNKAGANCVMAQDGGSWQNAQFRVGVESWSTTFSEGADATGNGWFWVTCACNFSNCQNFTL